MSDGASVQVLKSLLVKRAQVGAFLRGVGKATARKAYNTGKFIGRDIAPPAALGYGGWELGQATDLDPESAGTLAAIFAGSGTRPMRHKFFGGDSGRALREARAYQRGKPTDLSMWDDGVHRYKGSSGITREARLPTTKEELGRLNSQLKIPANEEAVRAVMADLVKGKLVLGGAVYGVKMLRDISDTVEGLSPGPPIQADPSMEGEVLFAGTTQSGRPGVVVRSPDGKKRVQYFKPGYTPTVGVGEVVRPGQSVAEKYGVGTNVTESMSQGAGMSRGAASTAGNLAEASKILPELARSAKGKVDDAGVKIPWGKITGYGGAGLLGATLLHALLQRRRRQERDDEEGARAR